MTTNATNKKLTLPNTVLASIIFRRIRRGFACDEGGTETSVRSFNMVQQAVREMTVNMAIKENCSSTLAALAGRKKDTACSAMSPNTASAELSSRVKTATTRSEEHTSELQSR